MIKTNHLLLLWIFVYIAGTAELSLARSTHSIFTDNGGSTLRHESIAGTFPSVRDVRQTDGTDTTDSTRASLGLRTTGKIHDASNSVHGQVMNATVHSVETMYSNSVVATGGFSTAVSKTSAMESSDHTSSTDFSHMPETIQTAYVAPGPVTPLPALRQGSTTQSTIPPSWRIVSEIESSTMPSDETTVTTSSSAFSWSSPVTATTLHSTSPTPPSSTTLVVQGFLASFTPTSLTYPTSSTTFPTSGTTTSTPGSTSPSSTPITSTPSTTPPTSSTITSTSSSTASTSVMTTSISMSSTSLKSTFQSSTPVSATSSSSTYSTTTYQSTSSPSSTLTSTSSSMTSSSTTSSPTTSSSTPSSPTTSSSTTSRSMPSSSTTSSLTTSPTTSSSTSSSSTVVSRYTTSTSSPSTTPPSSTSPVSPQSGSPTSTRTDFTSTVKPGSTDVSKDDGGSTKSHGTLVGVLCGVTLLALGVSLGFYASYKWYKNQRYRKFTAHIDNIAYITGVTWDNPNYQEYDDPVIHIDLEEYDAPEVHD